MPTGAAISSVMRVDLLLERHAREFSGYPALLAIDGTALSYAELAVCTDRIARRLATLKIAAGDRVAVVAPNGIDMAVAVLGVMRCATCAPLNPLYQQAEFEYFMDDLEPRALLVTSQSPQLAREVATARRVPIVEVGPELWASAEASPGMIAASARDDDIALVLHTSGTTARPKQVPLSHANLMASMANIAMTLRLTPVDRALNVMPLFHIHGLLAGLLAPLASGGSVVCAAALQLPMFFDWLERYGVTWYSAVPTMHQAIIAAAESDLGRRLRQPLRFIRSSSAALAPATLRRLEECFKCPVIESYGMTEAAHQMASNPLPPGERKAGSVGLSAGPEITIIEALGLPVPCGTRGEIAIRGDNVMRAYHANPEANRTAFTNAWFRTGDEGYFDSTGYLYITGRLKEIINRGGEKIAPREIDEALLAHPEVAQAVAFAVPHPSLGEDVAAAVVLTAGSALLPALLREFLFGRLADFKVPSEILILSEIPQGPTGKIQRIGLAERLRENRQQAFVAPRDFVEGILAQAWAEVLEVARIGIHDNFFALGGDSLNATRVAARVVALLPVELPTTALFRQPTVAELAARIRQDLGPSVIAELERILDEIEPPATVAPAVRTRG